MIVPQKKRKSSKKSEIRPHRNFWSEEALGYRKKKKPKKKKKNPKKRFNIYIVYGIMCFCVGGENRYTLNKSVPDVDT